MDNAVDFVEEHKLATDRLSELMNEYMLAKKAQREVRDWKKFKKLKNF